MRSHMEIFGHTRANRPLKNQGRAGLNSPGVDNGRPPGSGRPARRTRREAVGRMPLLDRGWLWYARGPSVPCAVEAVDAAADGAGRRSAGVDAAPGAAGEVFVMTPRPPRGGGHATQFHAYLDDPHRQLA